MVILVALLPFLARVVLGWVGAEELGYSIQFWGMVVLGPLFMWLLLWVNPRSTAQAEHEKWFGEAANITPSSGPGADS